MQPTLLMALFLLPISCQGDQPSTARQADTKPVFNVPPGWQSVPPNPFALARFEIKTDGTPLTVIVAGLYGEAGGLVNNINRWRAQLRLDPLSDDDARKAAKSRKIGGSDGFTVDITGLPVDGKPAQRILASMVRHGDHTWFFRISGPADGVGQEQANFGRFLDSVRFGQDNATHESTVRIETGVSGHIHPAICVSNKGALVAVYCKSEYQPYLITRSTDGGKNWSKPALFPHTVKTQVYPGSLTTLADGRLVHAWNVWFTVSDKVRSRYVAYSVSSDEGVTWSEPKTLAKSSDVKTHSVIRHPIVELSSTAWLMPLMDRTVVYNPQTGEESAFGEGRNHGLVPIVKTAKGTLISGQGLRSTDAGKTWQQIKPFPDVSTQGWRHELVSLKNGWLLASQVVGPGIGGEKINFILSRDDGQTWDLDHPVEFYDPGRPIGGRACPKTVQVNAQTLGTIFYDTDAKQPGGSGVFFRTMPMKSLDGR